MLKKKTRVWQLVYFLFSIYSYSGLGIGYSGLNFNCVSVWLWDEVILILVYVI
jgi:hypothetical protein